MSSPTAPAHRSAAEQALLDRALIDLCERKIVFNQTLGMRVEALSGPEGCRVRFEMRHELIGHHLHGRLHGGVTASVLDATAGLAVMVALGEKFAHEGAEQVMHRFMKLGTIDMRIDYLRPGIGQHFIATAEVVRLGGRVASTQMRLVNDQGVLVSTGAGAYMVS